MNDFTLTQTGGDLNTLAFSDAETCSHWLRSLALTNIPKVYATISGQLKRFSEADVPPRERARIAELFRDPVSFLHVELARRYAGKPQPATQRESDAADQALALWQ